MTNRHRLILLGFLSAGVFFLVGFLGSSQLPRLRSFVLVKIDQVSRENLPVRVLPSAIEINFLPLGTTLRGVKVIPKDENKDVLEPFEIEELSVSVSPWQLLQGKLRLSQVKIAGTSIEVNVPKTEKKSEKPLDGLFDALAKAPVSRLVLENVNVEAHLADPRLDVTVDGMNLVANLSADGVGIEVESAAIQAFEAESKMSIRVEVEADLAAARNALTISALKLRRGASFFVASGEAKGDVEALKFSQGEGSLRAELQLESMRNWAAKAFPHLAKMPTLKGRGFVESKIALGPDSKSALEPKAKQAKQPEVEVDFLTRTEGLEIQGFKLGNVETSGTYKDRVLILPKTKIQSGFGAIDINQAVVRTGEEATIEGHVSSPGLSLHELLKDVGAGKVPVYLQISADLPCSGAFTPEFSLTCKGKARGENLVVKGSISSPKVITALRRFDTEGSVTIDAEKVSYDAEIAMPESKGRSSGVISYADGFDIDYEADHLAIKDITDLVGLKLEGSAKLKGSTSGNSKTAVASILLDGSDLWLDNYWLGDAKTEMSYKAGQLSFANIQGHYSVSRYTGDVKLNLLDNEIQVQARVPFYDSRDLLKAFSRRVSLPFTVNGTGQAQIRVSGPLEFTKLSYDLRSSLFRGTVAGESFDQANFDVKAIAGEVTAERVQVTKGQSNLSLTGKGHPDGTIDTILRGRGIRIEDTNLIANSSFALSGVIDFDMDIDGPVLSPNTFLRGTVTKTSIGDQGVPDSSFNLKFSSQTIEGSGQFLGDVLRGDLVFPLVANAPFRLRLAAQNWNFAPVFAALAGPSARKDFDGKITGKIDLSAPSGGFWNATGAAQIEQFSLARGSLVLRNPQPITLAMKNGQLRAQNFELAGENIFLKVADDPTPVSKLDLQVNGKLDLGLLGILTPFFEDIRGMVSFKFNLRGGDSPLEMLGSAYLEKGYLKFFEFPHPFEDIKGDLVFNHRKFIFNRIRAEFGGGRIDAGGSMELLGYKNYPIAVVGTFDKVTLNVPAGIETTGSGSISLTGNWFPFLLKGRYDITNGLITKKIGGEEAEENAGIRRDYYLPDFLVQDNFKPIALDLDIAFPGGIDIKSEVTNGRIDGRISGQLAVQGNPVKPSVLGTVKAENDTKLTVQDNEFEVSTANIQFTDPNNIDPKLFIAARSRVKEYDVNLIVQGQGSKPELVLTSVPPLPEKDIISLLALGVTDSELDSNISSQSQASNVGLQAGNGAIKNNPISRGIKERLGVDVQFSAGFDDTKVSTQKIIVSRQVTPKLGVTASQSFGKEQESEAMLRYRLNDKFSLITSWQGRDETSATDTTKVEKNPNKVGLDVEYKFEFK